MTAKGDPIRKHLLLSTTGGVTEVVFSPDSKIIATGDTGGCVELRDVGTGNLISPYFFAHPDMIQSVTFSPDGKYLVTTGWDSSSAKLWSTATGRQTGPELMHKKRVLAAAFSPDSKTLATASADSNVQLWETATGQQIGFVLPHPALVVNVAFSPDGKILATASGNTLQFWEMAMRHPTNIPFQHPAKVRTVAFSRDGKTVLTTSEDGKARLWRAPRPFEGDPKRILPWVQVITNMEIDIYGLTTVLDDSAWQQRRERLQKLGGPPGP